MMTISRGGCTMTIVKSANFGVPPIVIGTHLDKVRFGPTISVWIMTCDTPFNNLLSTFLGRFPNNLQYPIT